MSKDKFYGRSKFGQYDKEKNRAPKMSWGMLLSQLKTNLGEIGLDIRT